MKNRDIRYYRDFSEDFEVSANQNYELDEDYKWIRTDRHSRLLSKIAYGCAYVFSSVYCRLVLKMHIIGAQILKNHGEGAFLYCNHTQPFGDVFMPALAAWKRRTYTVVSTANYGIPVIGRILHYLGALPIPKELRRIRDFSDAVKQRAEEGACITIYPEGHVWKYYSGVRPFSESSFAYPCRLKMASFCITSVYKKRKFFKKPRLLLYVDGPFYPNTDLPERERARELCHRIYEQMKKRCAEGNCEYIKYEKMEIGN